MQVDFRARRVFKPYMERKERYAIMVAHRRAGKTVATVQDLIVKAASLKLQPDWGPGRYAYVAPLYSQAKEIAWDYLRRFAQPLMSDANVAELHVTLRNGARIRLHGADNPDRLRGGYLDGCVLDEFADMRPSVLGQVIRPMLADRGGWLTAIGTPKGRNDFWRLWDTAQTDARWFSAMLRASETGLIDPKELRDAAADMTPEEYAQEFECSFEAAIIGAYYGKEIAQLERDGRVMQFEREKDVPLYTAWDLGISDSGMMALWVFQVVSGQIRVLDCYFNSGYGLEHYVRWLNDHGYAGQDVTDYVPHDAKVRELGTGKSRVEVLVERFHRKIALTPNMSVADGINAVKLELKRMWFNKGPTDEGLEALRQYRTDWDERKKVFSETPRRDWTTDIADAGRYMAVAAREIAPPPAPKREVEIGKTINRLTMDEFMAIEDVPVHSERV